MKSKRTYYWIKAFLGTYISTNKKWFMRDFGFPDSSLNRIRAFSVKEARRKVRILQHECR